MAKKKKKLKKKKKAKKKTKKRKSRKDSFHEKEQTDIIMSVFQGPMTKEREPMTSRE